MTITDLNKEFNKLKNEFANIKRNVTPTLSIKELNNHLDNIFKLEKSYQKIHNSVVVELNRLNKVGGNQQTIENGNNLLISINLFVGHLNVEQASAQNLLNRQIESKSERRRIFILGLSIVISVLISIFTPLFQKWLSINPNSEIEQKIDKIIINTANNKIADTCYHVKNHFQNKKTIRDTLLKSENEKAKLKDK